MKPLISAHQLSALIGQDELLVVDCRKQLDAPQSGRLAWAVSHIPGAFYAELDSDLSDLTKPGLGRHPLPDEAAFSAVLSRWGWSAERKLVAYDDAGGALAASRLWWMLRLVGASNVAVLDGGWSAWIAGGHARDSRVPRATDSGVSVCYDQSQLVGYKALKAALDADEICLLDARGAARYRGEVEPLDPVAGHVPGARNRPFADNLDPSGHFKSARLLADEFRSVIGDRPPASVVHMCGSGVTACHNLLAMEYAGLEGSRMFAPSWSGWCSDPSRAIAIGAEP
jgi:thiosulfate/3-mercaptopyruvate sulfurtransferase